MDDCRHIYVFGGSSTENDSSNENENCENISNSEIVQLGSSTENTSVNLNRENTRNRNVDHSDSRIRDLESYTGNQMSQVLEEKLKKQREEVRKRRVEEDRRRAEEEKERKRIEEEIRKEEMELEMEEKRKNRKRKME
ncbi:troponin I-like [Mercenaria mercenaria]|uniref:troponin I-like n=1 Tax=Mercenaria mercenaria TaxID=6596 RepID=UPI00234EE8DC|nr:troponin I-like [Mercenaria mercenaria]